MGGTERYALNVNGILMIRVIGFRGGHRRKRSSVCFADTEKSYSDLGVCGDAAQDVTTCDQSIGAERDLVD